MDWLTFTVEMIKAVTSLAWPLVTLAALYWARNEILSLIRRLKPPKKITFPGGSFEWAEELEKTRELQEITGTGKGVISLEGKAEGNVAIDNEYLKLAEQYPEFAVLSAFKGVWQKLLRSAGPIVFAKPALLPVCVGV